MSKVSGLDAICHIWVELLLLQAPVEPCRYHMIDSLELGVLPNTIFSERI